MKKSRCFTKAKNNKGVTLIALVVTTVVLVMIAGISMSSLTGNNGILNQVNVAKVEQIEATAREQVGLGVSAMKLAISEAAARDNSYDASKNAGLIQKKLVEMLNNDKSGLNGTFEYEEDNIEYTAEGTKITIIYKGDDYKNACNDTGAEIYYTITLGKKLIKITDEISATLKDENQNNVEIDVGVNTEKEQRYLSVHHVVRF